MNKFRKIKNKFDKKQISINDEDKEVIKNIDKVWNNFILKIKL